ncbi:actin monomer binding protein [Aspergillus heteromorphus CBS 117.55]|uniref:Twinfilin n=1 Tax=Aspergillus heteromorphus CBS 117.55 TaxID=1448321 RepID=A0A317V813_9EURO|nr:actin monomer binding protein [Aspergillus heteromorphus CBS 117.55]PWY69148.1 actin monomer binding protein [Aspergillus heteromorphus CBS 117.55]
MQSGISVSQDLHDAFNTFLSDSSIFCLPVTIKSESLAPLAPLRFSTPNAFYPSLSQLSSVLEPKTPLYLLLRRPSETTGSSSLVALTYIPSNAGVRAKTLFAATRATLARELGTEKFGATVFATEEEEVLGEAAWRERDNERKGGEEGGAGGFRREDLMGEKERELEAVRRAEEEARNGTPSRDIGIGGTFGRGGGLGGASGMRIQMHVDEGVKHALEGLQQGGLVQLAIDAPTEAFKVAATESGVEPNSVQAHIPPSSPRYTFYHYPDSDVVIFIYTCPSGSSIKERMLYASSRMHALTMAGEQGLKISKKIEASSPDEITGERLQEEVHPPQDSGPSRGFARPRRPGR